MVVVHHAGFAVTVSETIGAGMEPASRRLLVTFLHMAIGTPMFFVISGYCILASMDAMRRRGTSPWRFLTKRLWRTYPPYWAALLGFVAIVMGLDRLGLERLYHGVYALELYRPTALDSWQWLGNISLTEGWRPRVVGSYELVFTRVAWTLCFQEQFYFVCFLSLLIAPRRLYSTLVSVTVAASGLHVLAWDAGAAHRLAGTFPAQWHDFAVGLAVYWRLNVAASRAGRRCVDLGLLALLAIASWNELDSTVKAAGFGLVLIALRPWDEWLAGRCWLEPMRACGRRCYSIYLAHLPVCVVGSLCLIELGLRGFWLRGLVIVPAVSAAAVGASWLFYGWVERRFTELPAFHPVPLPGPPRPAPAFPGKAALVR
jgi:peptidoglycan/LPS O-acetylase OafA/YrhL